MTTLQGDVTALQGTVTTLQGTVDKLVHRTSEDRRQSLEQNRVAMNEDAALTPVPHPDTGLEPHNTPATVLHLRTADADIVNSLLVFYGVPRVGTSAVRRHKLAQALGCGHVC